MIFTLEHNGKKHHAKNIIVKDGLQLLRDGSRKSNGMNCLPFTGGPVSFNDTLASHPNWVALTPSVEFSGGTVMFFPQTLPSTTIVSNTQFWVALIDFTINGVFSLWDGAFFPAPAVSAQYLFSAAVLPAPLVIKTGDVIKVTYTITGASAIIL